MNELETLMDLLTLIEGNTNAIEKIVRGNKPDIIGIVEQIQINRYGIQQVSARLHNAIQARKG